MVDVFLIIFVSIIIAAAIFANIRVLLYYQHPDESKFATSLFCKCVIVVSLTLAWLVNILLPIDVRNSRPAPGLVDMQVVWDIAFITLAVFLLLIVPGAMFYAEIEGDDMIKKKRMHVFCNMFLLLFFSCSFLAVSYPFLSTASVPVTEYSCGMWQDASRELNEADANTQQCGVTNSDASLELKVGFSVYLIAVLCFVGWFFFVLFGGIGLSALPLDFILSWTDRPRAMGEQMYLQQRRLLGQATKLLIGRAQELQEKDGELANKTGWRANRQKKSLRGEYNKFKRDSMLIESEFEKLAISKFHKGENLAVSISKLVIGIFCILLSITWVLHIILGIMVPHIDPKVNAPFLGLLFEACESAGLYPFGVALFALFTLYLLACVVKGCLKFGMRVFFFFSIHPMRHQGTPMNSILFNVELVLITSAAVVQFSQVAFADYARLTDAEVVFSAQVKHLSFYSFFFRHNIFIYTLLAWFLLSMIYLLVKPRENTELKADKKAEKQLAKIVGGGKTPGKKSKAETPDDTPLRS